MHQWHPIRSQCWWSITFSGMPRNIWHYGHIRHIFILYYTLANQSLLPFGLFFTNSQCRMGIKVKYRAKSNRMTTFGLNTADSDFMAHQEGVVCRWEGVRSNNSSLTQHSEEMQWEKRQRGAREEEQKQDTNRDRSQIKRRWIGKARESDRAQKKKTEDHFEESHSLWSA